jgi:DNA-binding CsgD family transcriptional regulator/ketosteroid isomerase-like protein
LSDTSYSPVALLGGREQHLKVLVNVLAVEPDLDAVATGLAHAVDAVRFNDCGSINGTRDPIMSTEASILDSWFSAFNAHDVDAMTTVADPDIELVPLAEADTAPPGTVYRRHEGMRSMMVPGFERFSRLRIEPGAYETTGTHTIVQMTFVFDDGFADPPPTRKATSVFRFADGRICRVQAFDTWWEATAYVERAAESALTPREREVLALLAEGLNAEEVARDLVISPLTVRTHVRNAKEKLGARTMAHAIAIVLRSNGTARVQFSSR